MFAVLARAFHDKKTDAEWCYGIADAMLEARSQEPREEVGIVAAKPKRRTKRD